MNEDFAYLVETLGPPAGAPPVAATALRQWDGRLPSGLLELWAEYGRGSWAKGKFQLCDPDDFADLVATLLQGDPEFAPAETHLVGYGAFGDLVLWHETREDLQISLPYLRGTASCVAADWQRSDANVALSAPLMEIGEPGAFTLFEGEKTATPMFARCAKQHGALAPGECYGLFPALALGGICSTDGVKRVKAREHFALLAQLGPVRLVEYQPDTIRFIRELGRRG